MALARVNSASGLNLTEVQIYCFLFKSDGKKFTIKEILAHFGSSEKNSTMANNIRSLAAKGWITREVAPREKDGLGGNAIAYRYWVDDPTSLSDMLFALAQIDY